MLGHVYLHRSIMQQCEGCEVDIEDAAANWYDEVYRPAVTLIRKYNVLEHLGNRSEADLYLWLVEHLSEVRQLYGEEAETRSFSDALVDYLVARKLPVPPELLVEKDQTVQLSRVRIQEELDRLRPQMQAELQGSNGSSAEDDDEDELEA
jgi:hypothetical protein